MKKSFGLLICLSIAFATQAQQQQQQPKEKEPQGPKLQHYDINQQSPEEVGKLVSNKLYVKYKLSDNQKEAIKSITSVRTQKIQDLKASNPNADQAALAAKTKEVRDQYKSDLKDLLNPDQAAQLDKDVEAKRVEMEQRWHNGLGRRGHGGTNKQPVTTEQAFEEFLVH